MSQLIVALDVDSAKRALELVDELGELVEWYKVGAQLFTRAGPEIVAELKKQERKVFLDLKYHDIPNTVARAVAAATDMDVDMLTLHTTGGSAMMRAAREVGGARGPVLVGVTLLTSFTAADVEEVWDKELRSLRDDVARLAALAAEAGLDGVVASALEVETLKRRHGPEFRIVTAGIRPAGALSGDQARTATPADAVRAGADYLVVGRPIIEADEPAAVAAEVLEEMRAVPETEEA